MLDNTTNNTLEKNKNSALMKLVSVLFGATLVAYGWIFTSIIDRVAKAEVKIESINPTLLIIQTDLAEIKTNIKWMMGSDADIKQK
jgi:hypothetical protein